MAAMIDWTAALLGMVSGSFGEESSKGVSGTDESHFFQQCFIPDMMRSP